MVQPGIIKNAMAKLSRPGVFLFLFSFLNGLLLFFKWVIVGNRTPHDRTNNNNNNSDEGEKTKEIDPNLPLSHDQVVRQIVEDLDRVVCLDEKKAYGNEGQKTKKMVRRLPPKRDQVSHDVFISCGGENTHNIKSHLIRALSLRGIVTFLDDELISRDEISSAVLRGIEQSGISIVIFSEDYASSKRCLRELAAMMRYRRMNSQIVLPVFYGVHPSDVRKQTGSFKDSFAKHKHVSNQELQTWRDALTEASNMSGWDSSLIKHEATLVDDIAEDVYKLDRTWPLSASKGPIGIDPRGDGGGGGGVGGGDGGRDIDGGDIAGGGGGGGGKMGTEEEPEDQHDDHRNSYSYHGGDENGYPVGQLHRCYYQVAMDVAVMAVMATAIRMVGIKPKAVAIEKCIPKRGGGQLEMRMGIQLR